jgi:hypothetical protein
MGIDMCKHMPLYTYAPRIYTSAETYPRNGLYNIRICASVRTALHLVCVSRFVQSTFRFRSALEVKRLGTNLEREEAGGTLLNTPLCNGWALPPQTFGSAVAKTIRYVKLMYAAPV